jgi:hypothetical protein
MKPFNMNHQHYHYGKPLIKEINAYKIVQMVGAYIVHAFPYIVISS